MSCYWTRNFPVISQFQKHHQRDPHSHQSMTQSVPLAVVNSGAMLQPPSLQPSLRSPLSTIDQNAPFVQRRYSSHGPTDDHQRKIESIVSFGSNIITTAMAYVDVLFTDEELANSNTSGSNGYRQLDELKPLFLESTLRRKFESPVFTSQWECSNTHQHQMQGRKTNCN